ncbi:TPA: hypothetical protein ACPT2E_004140 [Klebsiella pneumoniae]
MRCFKKIVFAMTLLSISALSYAGTAEYYKTEAVGVDVSGGGDSSDVFTVNSEDKLSGCKFLLSFLKSGLVKNKGGEVFLTGRIDEGVCKGKQINKGWAFGTVSLSEKKDVTFLGDIRVIIPDEDFW